jgi:hypothetical protein
VEGIGGLLDKRSRPRDSAEIGLDRNSLDRVLRGQLRSNIGC